MGQVATQHSSAEVHRLITGLVAALAGHGGAAGREDLVRGIKLRIGLVALGLIAADFARKATGAAGEDGITWAPLKPDTIANRRVGPGDADLLKAAGVSRHRSGSRSMLGRRTLGQDDRDALGRVMRPFLTAGEDKRWRMIFATTKARLQGLYGLSEAEASARAGQAAWATLKAEGAKTKLAVLGSRTVAIGRDTGRLLNSLTPGVTDPGAVPLDSAPPEVEDQILRAEAGAIIVGSNVAYAGAFHAKRPLWPAQGLPEAWSEEIEEAAAAAVIEALVALLAA